MTHSIKYENVFYEIFISDGVSPGCHGYKRVMYDFPHGSLRQYFRGTARKPWADGAQVILVFHYNYVSVVIKFISGIIVFAAPPPPPPFGSVDGFRKGQFTWADAFFVFHLLSAVNGVLRCFTWRYSNLINHETMFAFV